jgi:hypothetical protein
MSKPSAVRLLGDLLGIIYLRRSPERLLYSRQMLIAAVVLALITAFAAHVLFLRLSVPYALLKIVCELGLFVIALNQTARIGAVRLRVLKMALALLLISALGDVVLVCLSFLPMQPPRQAVAMLVFGSQVFGGVNCVQFGVSVTWLRAAMFAAAYIVAALLFYQLASSLMAGFL